MCGVGGSMRAVERTVCSREGLYGIVRKATW